MKIAGVSLALLPIAGFAALSAIGGALGLILLTGMGIPLEYLRFTPFTSYVVPGLILGVVGGSALAAVLLLLQRRRLAYLAAFAAGAIMTGWIIAEVLLIRHFSWLQLGYLVIGLALMGLAVLPFLQAWRQSHILIADYSAR